VAALEFIVQKVLAPPTTAAKANGNTAFSNILLNERITSPSWLCRTTRRSLSRTSRRNEENASPHTCGYQSPQIVNDETVVKINCATRLLQKSHGVSARIRHIDASIIERYV